MLPAFGGQRLLDADWKDAPLVQILADDANGGLMDLGIQKVVGSYPLEKYKEAWDHAAEKSALGETVIMTP